MIFYILKTQPRRLVYTQAEAKASNQRWELHEVPTDKEGLLNYINALLAVDEAPAPATPDEPVVNKHGFLGAASSPGHCPMCDRSSIAAKRTAEIMTRVEIEEAIAEQDESGLDKLQPVIDERRAELASAAAARAAGPAIRKRGRHAE